MADGTHDVVDIRKRVLLTLAVVACIGLIAMAGVAGKRWWDSHTMVDCAPAGERRTLVGDVSRNERLFLYSGSERHHVVELDDGQESIELLVFGRPQLLTVGDRFEVELYVYDESFEGRIAWLHSSAPCRIADTTIRQVADDGSVSEIPRWVFERLRFRYFVLVLVVSGFLLWHQRQSPLIRGKRPSAADEQEPNA